jgi:Putative adhesin
MSGLGWKIAGGTLALASVGWGAFNVVDLVAHGKRTEVMTYDAADVSVLDVANSNGPVTIVGAAERDEVTVTARISDGLRATGERQTLVDGVLELRASCPLIGSQWCEVKYTIEVPADIEVRADTDNGQLTVSGIAGAVDLDADNGAVEVSDLGGNLTISADNSSIDATQLTSDTLVVETDNGSVTVELLEPPSSVEVRSDNGSVDVVLPDTEDAYALEVSTDNGDVSRDIRTNPESPRHILIDTDNGDAIVRYAP